MRTKAKKEDRLRALGIRLLRIPNAIVMEYPDEFGYQCNEDGAGQRDKVTPHPTRARW